MKINYGFGAWLATCVVAGLVIAYWAKDYDDPYEYDATESFVVPNPAAPATVVTADWSLKIKRVCPATSTRVLKDARTGKTITTYDATPAATTLELGDTRLQRTFPLPNRLPAEVKYSSKICFYCNPLHYVIPLCMDTPELTFGIHPPGQATRIPGLPEIDGRRALQ